MILIVRYISVLGIKPPINYKSKIYGKSDRAIEYVQVLDTNGMYIAHIHC